MSNKDQVRLEWKDRVAAFKTSGLSMKKWCDSQGIKIHQLQYWCSKHNFMEVDESPKQEWAPVNLINDPEHLIKSNNLKVSVGKCSIVIHPGFDSNLLLEVVKVLSEIC